MELKLPTANDFFNDVDAEILMDAQRRVDTKLSDLVRQTKIARVNKAKFARIVFDMEDIIDNRAFQLMKEELPLKGFNIVAHKTDGEGTIEVTLP